MFNFYLQFSPCFQLNKTVTRLGKKPSSVFLNLSSNFFQNLNLIWYILVSKILLQQSSSLKFGLNLKFKLSVELFSIIDQMWFFLIRKKNIAWIRKTSLKLFLRYINCTLFAFIVDRFLKLKLCLVVQAK